MTGDGRTAAKASAGRYYYVLSTGGGGVSNVNPNSNYFATYGWNDLNNDLKFQNGEQTGPAVLTSGTTTMVARLRTESSSIPGTRQWADRPWIAARGKAALTGRRARE